MKTKLIMSESLKGLYVTEQCDLEDYHWIHGTRNKYLMPLT